MMNKVDKLTRIFLKSSYQRILNKSSKEENSLLKRMFTIFGVAILVVYMMCIFGFLSYTFIDMLIKINQPALFIGMFLLVIAGLIIIQTIFSSINVFYFSKDIEFLLPLPIKPSELLMAKFNTILITEYITEIVFAIVPIFLFGIMTAAGISFYIYAVLVLFLFPILPALISCFIVMIIMSFSKLTKNRDKFQLVTTLLTIGIVVVMQMALSKNIQITDQELTNSILQVNGMVHLIGNYFITIEPSINAMISNDAIYQLISILIVAGISAGAYIVFVFLGKKLYLRGAIRKLVRRFWDKV